MARTSRFKTTPTLTAAEKRALKSWLERVLAAENLSDDRTSLPIGSRLHAYVDGVAYVVHPGAWQFSGQLLYVGQNDPRMRMSLAERLAVLSTIISETELWTELTDSYAKAMSRSLLESYNTMMQGMVQTSGGLVTKLAFNADRSQTAAFMEDGWYLPNGEAVDVTGWTVAE